MEIDYAYFKTTVVQLTKYIHTYREVSYALHSGFNNVIHLLVAALSSSTRY